MAAGSLPRPGTPAGPCAERCHHIDCAGTHSMAASICKHCGKPIGYETDYYAGDVKGEYVHALCAELEADQLRKAAV